MPKLQRAAQGSFAWLCHLYYGSGPFQGHDRATQSWKRRALNSICKVHGHKPIKLMEPRHVRKIRDERKDKPAAANHRMKAMRAMFAWAVEEEHAPHDPTLGVKGIKYVTKGHHSWEPDEIRAFEKRHPIGSKARLAKDCCNSDRPARGRRALGAAACSQRSSEVHAGEERAPQSGTYGHPTASEARGIDQGGEAEAPDLPCDGVGEAVYAGRVWQLVSRSMR